MDTSKASPEEAYIQLLHITPTDEIRFRRLINRLWFFYRLEVANTETEEAQLFDRFSTFNYKTIFDLFITDISNTSQLSSERQQQLLSFLRQNRVPLISLNDNGYSCYYPDPNWIHISLPFDHIEQHICEANEAITNYWFCLPSLKKSPSTSPN